MMEPIKSVKKVDEQAPSPDTKKGDEILMCKNRESERVEMKSIEQRCVHTREIGQ